MLSQVCGLLVMIILKSAKNVNTVTHVMIHRRLLCAMVNMRKNINALMMLRIINGRYSFLFWFFLSVICVIGLRNLLSIPPLNKQMRSVIVSDLVVRDVNTNFIYDLSESRGVYYFWSTGCAKSVSNLEKLNSIAGQEGEKVYVVSKESIDDICRYIQFVEHDTLVFVRIEQKTKYLDIPYTPIGLIRNNNVADYFGPGSLENFFGSI